MPTFRAVVDFELDAVKRPTWIIAGIVALVVASLSAGITLLSARLSTIDTALTEVRHAVETRVREDMMSDYERRFAAIEDSIIRLQDRLLNRAEVEMALRREAPYQKRWEAPDHP
jgi:hypothetical protein